MKFKFCVVVSSLFVFFAASSVSAESLLFSRSVEIGHNTFTKLFLLDPHSLKSNDLESDYHSESMIVLATTRRPVVASAKENLLMLQIPRNGLQGNYYSGSGTVALHGVVPFEAFPFESAVVVDSSDLFMHPNGHRAGYLKRAKPENLLMIYELPTLKKVGGRTLLNLAERRLLHQIPTSTLNHGCPISGLHWNQSSNKIVFTLTPGDMHATPQECANWVGTYQMKEDGTDVEKLNFGLEDHRDQKYLLAVLDDDRAVFMGKGNELFLYDRRRKSDGHGDYFSMGNGISDRIFLSSDLRFIAYTTAGCEVPPVPSCFQAWVRELTPEATPRLLKNFYVSTDDPCHISLIGWHSDK